MRQERTQEIPKTVASVSPHGLAYADPSCVCVAVKRVATGLDALRSFVWAGQDYPLDDDIWLVLRQSCVPFLFLASFACAQRGLRCPSLKSIGVRFGALLPGVRSHVRLSSRPSTVSPST